MRNLFPRLLLIQAVFSILWTMPSFAQEAEEKISIELAHGESISINMEPDIEDMKKALGLAVSDEIRQKIEAQGGSVTEVDPMSGWKSLSHPDRQKFSDLRVKYLKQLVKILDKMHGLVGVGIVTGDAFKFTVQKTKAVFVKPHVITTTEKKEMSERKRAVIESIARAVDYKLWFQAPLLINANEFGIQASAGIIGLGGFQKKGGGGLEEIGISLAYNKETKAFIFEVFHNGERFESTPMPVFNVGLNAKLNLTMKVTPTDGSTKVSEGSTFYPPGFPGSTSYGADMYAAGVATGLGFPPPPLSDLLTFTNSFKRTSLVQVSVSPLIKGFIRVKVGDLRVPVKSIAYRFVDIYNGINYLLSKIGKKNEVSPAAVTEVKKAELKIRSTVMTCERLLAL